MKKLRWGIIGPGRIAVRFAEAIPAADHSILQAVHSSCAERAEAFAKKHGALTFTTNLKEFLSDQEIDVVYIANPHIFHADSAEKVLQAGKAVLCEKPLTVSVQQASDLTALAREKNLFLMEALWSRFLPVWQQVRKWLDQGEIGDMQLLSSSFGFRIDRDPQDRLLNKKLGGGALLDMGVYNVSMSQFVMQQYPDKILADVMTGDTGVDERTIAILKYGDVVNQFITGFTAMYNNDFSIHGTKGNIYVSPSFWDTTRAVLKPFTGEETIIQQAYLKNGFEYQIMEVERCLAEGKLESETIKWADTINTQQIMESILSEAGINYI